MTHKRHTPEQIIRKLRTAGQLLNQGQTVRRRLDRRDRATT